MKSKYLLSALAIGASFAACSNEDIMVNETVATNEVVGAKLLGTGLSLNISNGEGTGSRATVDGWEAGKDVAGLGWVVKDTPAELQTGAEIGEVEKTLYSNHFYQYTEEGWNTKSNIYEGWHFAYLPYAHQSKPGELTINVNERPYAGGDYKADIYNNAPHISAAAFLSEDNVDTKNGTITESYSVKRIVNALYPTIEVSEDFTGNELLKEIAIESITVGVTDKNQFYTSVSVNPSALPVNKYDEDGNYDEAETSKQFNNDLYAEDGALKVNDYAKSITTTLAEGFKLDETEQQLRIFLAPTRDQWLNKANLYFRIDVAGGHFDVKYTDPESLEEGQELTEIQEKNNEAINKMYGLLYGGWTDKEVTYSLTGLYTTNAEGEVVMNNPYSFKLGLGLENFTADYMVNDITDWNASVALANALEEENPVFTLYTEDGKTAEVVFDGEEILAPANGVKVEGEGKLVVASDLTWNNDVVVEREEKGLSIQVEEDAQLSVVGGTLAPYRLFNDGTILADATSAIGAEGYNSLYTNNRIIVEYGAYVYPKKGNEGIIAYEVPADYSFDKIATLISTDNTAGQANVNTLIIGEGVSLNCVKTTVGEDTEGDDDRYNPTQGTQGTTTTNVLNLKDVNLEINGGSIFAEENKEVSVNDVVMNGGNMTNVDIDGDVLVESGENTISNAKIGQNVTVEAGSVTLNDVNITGNLVNKGTATINGEGIVEIANIESDGTLNANTEVIVKTIAVNSGSEANVAEDKTIWYTTPLSEGGYVQKGTTSGQILFYGTKQFLDDLKAVEDGGTVTLKNDVELTTCTLIEKDITLDLNGKTLSCTGNNTEPALKNTGVLTIVNGKISSVGVGVQNNGTLVVNCDIESVGNAVNNVYDGKTTIEGGSYKNTATDKATIYSDGWGSGKPELIINGGTFEAQFTCVSYNNASTGAVNKGTFTTQSEHCIYVGGSEGGCNVTYNASGCTFVNKGSKATVFVGDMSNTGTKENTVNGTVYTGNQTVLP